MTAAHARPLDRPRARQSIDAARALLTRPHPDHTLIFTLATFLRHALDELDHQDQE